MENLHWHWCGDPVDAATVGKGCGHVWQHPTKDYDTDEELDAAHTCPRCGRGPWTYRRLTHELFMANGQRRGEVAACRSPSSNTSRPGGSIVWPATAPSS